MEEYSVDQMIIDVIDIIDNWEKEGLIPERTICEGVEYVDILSE